MDSSRVISFQQLGGMESMNHVSMDVEDGQALIMNMSLKCPRCESTNTKFFYYQNQQKSQPRHFCKDCLRSWSVNGKLRDIPVGRGERKRRQPEIFVPDHARVVLQCPHCESTNTKFFYYQNQDKSKPFHFCNDCRRQWTVGGSRLMALSGGRKRRLPESSMANQASMSQEKGKYNNLKYQWPMKLPCVRWHWNVHAVNLSIQNSFTINIIMSQSLFTFVKIVDDTGL
ncbi:hypothetical protein AQUCO_01600315v1 [Aquilegia coerulea]|uniref:Dof zinc finger protein n=1 Tax=Aquilegia coerulea TaxID=218851 RepID=A0A2G5DR18_AQUCA|nr:hypothetical protein AQUCO_01600315v1 [Aquilegia coerulea]